MRIEQPDLTDEKVTRACYDVMLAAHKVDEPVEPPMAYSTFSHYLHKRRDENGENAVRGPLPETGRDVHF